MREPKLIAEWISENYSSAEKIVEVGVGRRDQVLSELKDRISACSFVATDVHEVSVPEGVEFRLDDVIEPNLEVYKGADVIFSYRAPPELYSPLENVAREVGAELLVKPVSSEESPSWGELLNYSGVAFYLLRP